MNKDKSFYPAAAIFDMDGLMLDTEKMCIPLWTEAGNKFGFNITEEVILRMIGLNNIKCRKILLDEFGDSFSYDEISNEFKLLCKREFEKGIPHKKGLIYILDFFKNKKIPVGVATSTRRVTALYMLEKAGILDRFTAVTGGDEVENGKPAPDIFLLAAEKLGQPASACVGFEDSPAGLKGLQSAGIRSVFIKDILEPPQDVLNGIWRRCNDLIEAAELFSVTQL